jgi:hypothetical protein
MKTSALLMLFPALAIADFLPIYIPCKEPKPTPAPEIPEGCQYQTEITPTITVSDPSSLQFYAAPVGDPWPSFIRPVTFADCVPSGSRYRCSYTWEVPEGASEWQWQLNGRPIGSRRCVFRF